MQVTELFSLREQFNQRNILLSFNGPFSKGLLEETGMALKNYTQKDGHPSVTMDVFSVYIELTQNIRHYGISKGYNDLESSATLVVARDSRERYVICAGNLIEPDDAESFMAKIAQLASMDKAEIKAAYKKKLREPRDLTATSGAGLGLLEVARKTSEPLTASLAQAENGKMFLSLLAVI
jgi:hypothetical protein